MSAGALYGLLAWALLAAAGAALFARRRPWPLALLAAGLALTPLVAGESAAVWLHGAVGTPSATLLQLAILRLAAPRLEGWLRPPAALALLATAALFYPAALGWGDFDPYALGFRPWSLLAALLPLAAWLAWRRADAWLLLLGVDLLAYAAGLYGNLWDALIDPALVLCAGVALASTRYRRRQAALSPGTPRKPAPPADPAI